MTLELVDRVTRILSSARSLDATDLATARLVIAVIKEECERTSAEQPRGSREPELFRETQLKAEVVQAWRDGYDAALNILAHAEPSEGNPALELGARIAACALLQANRRKPVGRT